MYALLALSIVGLACVIERFANFRPAHILQKDLAAKANELWQTNSIEKLNQLCESDPSVLSQIIAKIVRYRNRPYSEVSQVAGELANAAIRAHLQKAYPLGIVATLSPLVGLLGTVVGMIYAFHDIALAGDTGNASVVAGGISIALNTTAAGLIIGIPALGMRHYFNSRINKTAAELEVEVNTLLHAWLLEDAVES